MPVYLGDSLQWGQETSLLTHEGLTVSTSDGAQLFADQLQFPDAVVSDAGRFDRLVSELADKAANRATELASALADRHVPAVRDLTRR